MFTLKSLSASACKASEFSEVRGDVRFSFEYNNVGCLHKTQSGKKNKAIIIKIEDSKNLSGILTTENEVRSNCQANSKAYGRN